MKRSPMPPRTEPMPRGNKPMPRTAMKRKRSKRQVDYAAELDAITPALIDRAGGQCELQIPRRCDGGSGGWHRHHRQLRSQGGKNELTNLLWVCAACHDYIHRNPAVATESGWIVPQSMHPSRVGVTSWRPKP